MVNLPVILIGAGGHAKVLMDALLLRGVRILGVTDLTPSARKSFQGHPIIGDDDEILRYSPEDILLVNAIGSTRSTERRRQVYEQFKARGYSFAAVIHPTAVIARDVRIGEGAQIMAGAVIQAGSEIGANAVVNTRASIDHDCVIGDHVHLAPGVIFSGGVKVGSGTHIGTGATVIQNVQIGSNSLVGAGSLVLNDVPPGTKVFGSPARVVLENGLEK